MESRVKLLGHPIHPMLVMFPVALFTVAVLLFALSWLLRIGDLEYAPGILPFVVALIGIGIALVTAWLGGELVYRLRIGVDDIASDDAPSSLGAGSPHAAAREQLAAQRPKRVT